MSSDAMTIAPPSRWRVLAAGLATAARRPSATPTLPAARLALPEAAIDSDRVAAYRALCDYQDAVGVPALYLHLLAFPLHMALMMRRDFPFPMAGLVHIANRVVQHAPITAGDGLTMEAGCGALLSHSRGQAFTVEARATRRGETVWEGTSTYLHRRAEPGIGDVVAITPRPPQSTTSLWSGQVTPRTGRRYAALSGDCNPIHTSAIGARLLGFPRPIAHGMWSLARAVAELTPRAVDAVTIDAAFQAPLLLPGQVVLTTDGNGAFTLRPPPGGRSFLTGQVNPAPLLSKGSS